MKKILTIVIPTYNVEKYLERCLDSLTYNDDIQDDIEILVVNDGSKDNSLKIAKEYEKKFPSVIVIDKENGGHGSTINAGLVKASGKYFRVIDSDDWVNVIDFRKYVLDLKKLDCDVVLTNFSREYIYSGISDKFKYPEAIEFNKIYDLDKFDLSLFKDDYFFMATTTYKTSILKDNNFKLDEHMFYVDMEYVVFPLPNINNFILLDYDIYRYFIGRPDQSVNINGFVKNRKHHEYVFEKLVNFYTNTKMSKNKRDYVKKIILLMSNTHYIIYLKSGLLKRKDIKEIKKFDKKLKKINLDLYNEIGNKYMYIRWNRKTKFIFKPGKHCFFSRLADRHARRKGVL